MNSPEQWTRVATLLAIATNTPASQRDAWIDGLDDTPETKTELRRMLGAWADAGAQGFLDEPVLSRPFSDDRLGTLAGEFTLIRRLGSGGVGQVYLGFNEDPAYLRGRPAQVAVKILHRRFREAGDVLAAFARERALLKSLCHTALVPILDSGTTTDGLPYLIMEYVEGQPIDVFCNRRPVGLQQRLNLFRQLCDTVSYLHQRKVLHLDLKPSNVLVTPAGEVKLLDLGLARLISETGEDGSRFVSAGFSSPEQVCGKKLGVSTDVYSLGAVLYILLTGRLPLELEHLPPEKLKRAVVTLRPLLASAVLRSAQPADRGFQVPVSLTEWETALKGPLDKLLRRLLQPAPWKRPSSATRLSAYIFTLQRKSFTPPRSSPGIRHHLVSVTLLVFGLLLLGGASWEAWKGFRGFQEVRTMAATQKEMQEVFINLRTSPPAERQRFVADQTARLERTYHQQIPELLNSEVAPRRQIASYALASVALLGEMAPVATERKDLASASFNLLQRIATLEHDDLHNDAVAQDVLSSANLFRRSAAKACAR